jgi:hypothetical protein
MREYCDFRQLQEEKPMMRLPRFCAAVFVVGLLVSVAAAVVPDEISGKIQKVDADKFELVVQTNARQTLTFMMDEDAQVLLNDQEATLADLRPGDTVVIMSRKDGEQWMAIEVRCRRQ